MVKEFYHKEHKGGTRYTSILLINSALCEILVSFVVNVFFNHKVHKDSLNGVLCEILVSLVVKEFSTTRYTSILW